jgi:hypothetical protein
MIDAADSCMYVEKVMMVLINANTFPYSYDSFHYEICSYNILTQNETYYL